MSKRARGISKLSSSIIGMLILAMTILGIHNFFTIERIDSARSLLAKPSFVIDIDQDDTIKYQNSNHTLCDLVDKSYIYLGSHHKTGSVLLNYQLSQKTITPYLKDKCQRNGKLDQKKKHNIFHNSYHVDGDTIDKWIKKFKSHNTRNDHLVILNIIRNPVDTIISAYNYHYKGSEGWVTVNIPDITERPFRFQEKKENTCTSKLFTNITAKMGLSPNVSIQSLYKNILTSKKGIDFEYQRYTHCCFNEIYSSYNRINDLLNLNHSIFEYVDVSQTHFHNFRVEQFAEEFKITCMTLMDKLGILQNEDRENLLAKFKKYDLNKMSAKKIAKSSHITKGKYDKKAQIKLLLTDPNKCNDLKAKTELLGYQWNFDGFC